MPTILTPRILLIPEHAELYEKCQVECARAITYAHESEVFAKANLDTQCLNSRDKAKSHIVEAKRIRDNIPPNTFLYALCDATVKDMVDNLTALWPIEVTLLTIEV